MKILLITPYFYPHKGGSQQYAEELHYHLMRKYRNIQVDVLCYNTDNAPEYEEYRGMRIYRIPCWQPLPGQFAIPNYLMLVKTIKKLFKKNKYNLVNSQTRFFETSWWTPFLAKHYKIPSVLTDHCAYHPVHPSYIVSTIATQIDKILVPIISRQYTAVTVTNKSTRSFLRSLGVQSPQIIYGGVDTKFYAPSRTYIRKSVPGLPALLNENELLVTFVGRMIPSKGPQLLLQSAKKIVKIYPNVTVIFAGDGPLYKNLSTRKNKKIHFVGALQREDVAKLLNQTNILVHPSLHHEGFPNVLLEAGSSGCAVIATDQGGTSEIITHEKTGIIVEPTEPAITVALKELIENENLRAKYSKALRTHTVKTYDWKHIISSYHTLLLHLRNNS